MTLTLERKGESARRAVKADLSRVAAELRLAVCEPARIALPAAGTKRWPVAAKTRLREVHNRQHFAGGRGWGGVPGAGAGTRRRAAARHARASGVKLSTDKMDASSVDGECHHSSIHASLSSRWMRGGCPKSERIVSLMRTWKSQRSVVKEARGRAPAGALRASCPAATHAQSHDPEEDRHILGAFFSKTPS